MAERVVLLRLEAKICMKYRLIWPVPYTCLVPERQHGGERRVGWALGMKDLGCDEFRGITVRVVWKHRISFSKNKFEMTKSRNSQNGWKSVFDRINCFYTPPTRIILVSID